MNDFIFSINATFPIFLVMVLGWVLMRIGFFTKEFTRVADKYVFKVSLPVLLFMDIWSADIRSDFDIAFCLFCMVVTLIMFLGVWALSYILLKDKTLVGAFTQGSVRGSAAVLGIAFVNNIYGNSGMTPLMIVSAVPLYNILSVVILTFSAEFGKEKTAGKVESIKKACVNVIKNPIIIGIVLGLIASVIDLKLPVIFEKALKSVSQTATPIALLVVGAGFEGTKAIKKIKPTLAATFIKLVLLPFIFFPFAVGFGFRGSELVAILVMLGAPTTVTSYIMAKNMGNDEVLSSSIVVLATLLSTITLTGWVYILKIFELI